MENILNSINSRCVSLTDTEVKRNNVILHKVIDTIVAALQSDKLFAALFERKFYGGSFYDGLKVGNSTEFDIDMIFVLPESCAPTLKSSNKPGFIHISVAELQKVDEKYKGLENLCDASTKLISAKKTLSWVESLLTKCFNKFWPPGTPVVKLELEGKSYNVMVKPQKSGPSFNMNIVAKSLNNHIEMDVDLVPCFQFSSKSWPSKPSGYRQWNASKHGKSDKFLAVPKLPTDVDKPDFYWRLSFQEQERELISGNELGRLKPALRLIKKVRDHWKHIIASYYIKTVFLWEVEKRKKEFWNQPLAIVFCEMLKIYGEQLKNGSIKYFWNEKYNLISNMKKSTLDGIANKINNIVTEIHRVSENDPFVVAKYIVSPEEVDILRREVVPGKKKIKLPTQTASNYSTPVLVASSTMIKEEAADKLAKKSNSSEKKNVLDVTSRISASNSSVEQNMILIMKNQMLEAELNRLRIENLRLKK